MAQNNPWSKPEKPNNNMYPPSPQKPSSSVNHGSSSNGLTRFGSAPSSLITRAVESVIGTNTAATATTSLFNNGGNHNHHHHHHQYFSSSSGGGGGGGGCDSSSISSESTCKVNSSNDSRKTGCGLQRSYGFNELGGSHNNLLRQKSSPAGLLSHHLSNENGFSITPGSSSGGYNSHNGPQRLKSQLSYTGQDTFSQMSEVSENVVEGISSNNGFGIGSWDTTNSIVFSGPPTKRMKNIDGDIYTCLNGLETQFSLPQTSLEMATVEKLLNIPEDSVACKIRAKRGCATHPRSIAERERRTRISGRLKKLQDLVPNMDKQTSYADMLDLAVQHIKGLQGEVQKLQKELEHCTCGCNKPTK